MEKYVVLERTIHEGEIVNCFGVFRKHKNAINRVNEIGQPKENTFFCIEKVDEMGSFADEECEDE